MSALSFLPGPDEHNETDHDADREGCGEQGR
jgi:hypothetical protein